MQALLDGGDEIGGDLAGQAGERRRRAAETAGASEKRRFSRLDEAQPHLVAEAGAHDAAQIADAVDEAVRAGRCAR